MPWFKNFLATRCHTERSEASLASVLVWFRSNEILHCVQKDMRENPAIRPETAVMLNGVKHLRSEASPAPVLVGFRSIWILHCVQNDMAGKHGGPGGPSNGVTARPFFRLTPRLVQVGCNGFHLSAQLRAGLNRRVFAHRGAAIGLRGRGRKNSSES